ncbi:MAG: ABC transporter substrate-binding protein [Chloroflexi bacterium]|nr:ABC transporter substrate-binding protein [Chloroflexota bacterium]MCL5075084.1 ABC transporter substrate-binding protein [Chloroflexota bacterium]
MKRFLSITLVVLFVVLAIGCAPAAPAPTPTKAPVAAATPTKPAAVTPTPANPVDLVELKGPVEIVYWHTFAGATEKAQQKIIDEFQKKYPNIKIKAEYAGNFNQIAQKLMAATQAGSLPDVAVAYENNIANYAKAGVVLPLEDYVASKKYGLPKESMDDFFPLTIQRVTFPRLGNKLLGFPFTISNLVMYYNEDMLKQAGVSPIPPTTWDEFLAASKAVKEKLGKSGIAISPNASITHAIIYSYGGKVFSDDWRTSLYDQPAGLKAFQLLETIVKGGYGYAVKITPTIGDDANDFAAGKTAFCIRTATNIPFFRNAIKDKFKWSVALIPQAADNKDKATVTFGPSVVVFKSTPEKQLAAWEFLKFFTSREVTAEWAMAAGFLPVRLSAREDPKYKAFLESNPVFRAAFEITRYGKREMPNLAASAEIRNYVDSTSEAVVTLTKSPAEAAKELTIKANKLLAEEK